MTPRTFTTLLFALATAMGMLLSIIVTEYDLPLVFVPFVAYAVGAILYDVHAAHMVRYLEDWDGH